VSVTRVPADGREHDLGSSYRPGDVVTMYGGKRVEVLNPTPRAG
jgi:hypothetical protein